MTRAEAVLNDANQQAAVLEFRGQAMHVRLGLAELWTATDPEPHRGEREQTLREAITLFAEVGDQAGLGRAWMLVGIDRFDKGHAQDAEAAWVTATAHGRLSGVPRLVGDVTMCLTGSTVWGPVPVADALRRFDEIGPDIAGQPYREAFLLRGRSSLAAMSGDYAAARGLLRRGRLILQDLGLAYSGANMAFADFDVALREGDFRAAETALRADDTVLEQIGERWVRSTVSAMLAHTLHALGDATEAEHYAELARELASADDVWSAVLWRSALAKVRARGGASGEARRYATEAVSIAAGTDWLCMHGDALLDLAEVHRLTQDLPAAAAAVGAAQRLYEKKGDLASVARTKAFRSLLDSTPS